MREVAQSGSAPRLGRGGRRFKSCLPDFTFFGGQVSKDNKSCTACGWSCLVTDKQSDTNYVICLHSNIVVSNEMNNDGECNSWKENAKNT